MTAVRTMYLFKKLISNNNRNSKILDLIIRRMVKTRENNGTLVIRIFPMFDNCTQ